MPAGKAAPYYFEVEYATSEEVNELLEDLVTSYRMCHDESIFGEIVSPAEQKAVKDKAGQAAIAIESMFGSCPSYPKERPSDEIGVETLQKYLATLREKVESVQSLLPGGINATRWSAPSESVDELSDELNLFTRTETEDGRPVFWPFVRTIRVYSRSLFLSTGIILADLPGE
jgi:hypothetical protein